METGGHMGRAMTPGLSTTFLPQSAGASASGVRTRAVPTRQGTREGTPGLAAGFHAFLEKPQEGGRPATQGGVQNGSPSGFGGASQTPPTAPARHETGKRMTGSKSTRHLGHGRGSTRGGMLGTPGSLGRGGMGMRSQVDLWRVEQSEMLSHEFSSSRARSARSTSLPKRKPRREQGLSHVKGQTKRLVMSWLDKYAHDPTVSNELRKVFDARNPEVLVSMGILPPGDYQWKGVHDDVISKTYHSKFEIKEVTAAKRALTKRMGSRATGGLPGPPGLSGRRR